MHNKRLLPNSCIAAYDVQYYSSNMYSVATKQYSTVQ